MNAERPSPSFAQLVRTFARIGCLGFGGPAGQIAMMQREVVDERGWVDQGAFLRAINLCHLLPGPEAQQLATWIGWRLHGVKGGLAAGGLFVLPGALVMLGLSALYAMAAGVGWFAALFLGIKAAVVAILAQALLRIGKRALRTRAAVLMAVAAFLALAVFSVPFPVAIVAAGIGGALTEVKGLVEKPKVEDAPSNLIISGRYILQPDVMRVLENQSKGAGGEVQLTDAMAQMIGQQPFHAVTFAGRRFDCGSKTGFVEATLALALEREDMGAEVRAMAKRLLG